MLQRAEIPNLCISAVVVCLCLVFAHWAEATPSISWSGVQDIELTSFGYEHLELDLDGNGSSDFRIRHAIQTAQAFALVDGNEFFCTIDEEPDKYPPAARPEAAGVLADDSPVDPHVWYEDDHDGEGQIMMAYGSGYWANTDHDYMGVRFLAGSDLHYGWIEMSLDGSLPNPMTIHSWAYETQPGVGIMLGMVPEPSTWMLFLTGLGCLLCRLRHRRKR